MSSTLFTNKYIKKITLHANVTYRKIVFTFSGVTLTKSVSPSLLHYRNVFSHHSEKWQSKISLQYLAI